MTMKTVNFREYFRSLPIDKFQDRYLLVFDLTSMQDATENCLYPELVEELLRSVLDLTYAPEHVTELIALGIRMSSVAVDKFGVVGKKIYNR